MNALHQFWIGKEMPENIKQWCGTMPRLARGLGMEYRLDGWDLIAAHYHANKAVSIFNALRDLLPTPTFASLVSDWYRLRILGDEGGLYADTDFCATGVPQWRPRADVALFQERYMQDRTATELTWCSGARGMAACTVMADALEKRLLDLFGNPDTPGFYSRAVQLVRMDTAEKNGMSLVYLAGPAYVRENLLPLIQNTGYTVEPIPYNVAFNKHQSHTLPQEIKPAIWHLGSGSWRRKDGWKDLAELAARRDEALREALTEQQHLQKDRTIHQICAGKTDDAAARIQTVKALAAAMGWQHKLWSLPELQARYAGNPMQAQLASANGYLPQDLAEAFAAHWYKLALLEEFGGACIDRDLEVQDPEALAHYTPDTDVAVYTNKGDPFRFANSVIWCNGARGRRAMACLLHAIEERMRSAYPTSGTDHGKRLACLLRLDRFPHAPRFCIGPAFLLHQVETLLDRSGFTLGKIPQALAAPRKAAMLHTGRTTWCSPSTDWFLTIGLATRMDKRVAELRTAISGKAPEPPAAPSPAPTAAPEPTTATAAPQRLFPAHLAPQGSVILPARLQARKDAPAPLPEDEPERPTAAQLAMVRVPRGLRRIIVFSNVTRGFPHFELKPGDWCIHINTGRHIEEAVKAPGTKHALFVRHGRNPKTKLRCWYVPESFEGMEQVRFINDHTPAQEFPWWREYLRDNPGRCPTSGWIVANLMRTLAPSVPLFLLGFDPGVKHGTPEWAGHAWTYEAEWYAKKNFTVIKPHGRTK